MAALMRAMVERRSYSVRPHPGQLMYSVLTVRRRAACKMPKAVQQMSSVARYLGYRRAAPPEADVSALMEKAAGEMQAVMKAQAVFEIYDLSVVECRDSGVSKPPYEPTNQVVSIRPSDYSTTVSFADVILQSRDLGRNLSGCSQVALLAATIGPQVDALIRRHSSLAPVYASILQATGAMFIEELVDLVNSEIKKIAAGQGLKTRLR